MINLGLIAVAVFLRLKSYLVNEAFTLDEAWRALSINGRSFKEILQGEFFFPDCPVSPLGLSLFTKISVVLFGNQEMAFRLFPLLYSLACVFLLYVILKRHTSLLITAIVLGFFALTPYVVSYSAIYKPFASDVFFTLCLYAFVKYTSNRNFRVKDLWFLGIIGGLTLWFSNVTVFVLAAIGLSVGSYFLVKKKWKELFCLMGAYGLILISFIILYKHILQHETTIKSLHDMWLYHFYPYSKDAVDNLVWLKRSLLDIFKIPAGLGASVWSVGFFMVGVSRVFRRNKVEFGILFLPYILIVIASILHKFPLGERVCLFLVPSILFFIAEGIVFCAQFGKKYSAILCIIFLLLTSKHLLMEDVSKYFVEKNHRYIDLHVNYRDIFEILRHRFRVNDSLLINFSSQAQFCYYAPRYGLLDRFPNALTENDDNVKGLLIGKFHDSLGTRGNFTYALLKYQIDAFDLKGNYIKTIDMEGLSDLKVIAKEIQLKLFFKGRTWIMISYAQPGTEEYLLETLDHFGTRLETYRKENVSLYLYDLKKNVD